jgi:hypothetical protein
MARSRSWQLVAISGNQCVSLYGRLHITSSSKLPAGATSSMASSRPVSHLATTADNDDPEPEPSTPRPLRPLPPVAPPKAPRSRGTTQGSTATSASRGRRVARVARPKWEITPVAVDRSETSSISRAHYVPLLEGER